MATFNGQRVNRTSGAGAGRGDNPHAGPQGKVLGPVHDRGTDEGWGFGPRLGFLDNLHGKGQTELWQHKNGNVIERFPGTKGKVVNSYGMTANGEAMEVGSDHGFDENDTENWSNITEQSRGVRGTPRPS